MSEPNASSGELYCPTCETTYVCGPRCPADNTRLVRLAPSIDELIGHELDGRYKILARLGGGAMGTVYRGMQHSVGRECAIKVMKNSLVSEPIAIKRFLREAKLASRLVHPNAVSVIDFGQSADGVFFLAMELIDGRTLDQVLAEHGPLPPARVVQIGVRIAEALEGAHELKIVHRDLKPANVMILSTGRDVLKVLDFGLAKTLSPQLGTPTTQAGMLLGTPAYMPPELINGQTCDGRADLYSLGCMLYELASGRVPFAGATVHEMIAMHVHDEPPRLTGVPRKLAAVIGQLLAKRPADRFRTAKLAREALEAAIGGYEDSLDGLDGYSSTLLGWSGLANDTVRSQPPPAEMPRSSSSSIDPEATTSLVASDAETERRKVKASEPGALVPMPMSATVALQPKRIVPRDGLDEADTTVPDHLARLALQLHSSVASGDVTLEPAPPAAKLRKRSRPPRPRDPEPTAATPTKIEPEPTAPVLVAPAPRRTSATLIVLVALAALAAVLAVLAQ